MDKIEKLMNSIGISLGMIAGIIAYGLGTIFIGNSLRFFLFMLAIGLVFILIDFIKINREFELLK